jgi:hypothetical protein
MKNEANTFELCIYFSHEYNFICSLKDNVIMPARGGYNLSFNVERSIADICDTLNHMFECRTKQMWYMHSYVKDAQ